MSLNSENKDLKKATFAGGCFWCMEETFEGLQGVVEVISGYTGGHKENPSYEEVSYAKTGHLEAVEVIFDPLRVSYQELLDLFWRHIDPTDNGGQFADRGPQYRTAIFYHNEEQRRLAERSKEELERAGIFKEPIVTEIREAVAFHKAEEYHQDYYKSCPLRYKSYKEGSGRSGFLSKVWAKNPKGSKSSKEALRERLTSLQYRVTQEGATEPPFNNEYWDNDRAGIYVDLVSGEALFSSLDKFSSGTGWPSFKKPLEPDNIVQKPDRSGGYLRTEVRSKNGDSHLGHLFKDGPEPTGMRYCINSAALRFIPLEDLESEGYAEYKRLFHKR
jgi:peptide methionine sulfoxide reductase msrA/msrB